MATFESKGREEGQFQHRYYRLQFHSGLGCWMLIDIRIFVIKFNGITIIIAATALIIVI